MGSLTQAITFYFSVIMQLNGAYEDVGELENMTTEDSNLNAQSPVEIQLRMSSNENTAPTSSSFGT
jgi:hypothetical protein